MNALTPNPFIRGGLIAQLLVGLYFATIVLSAGTTYYVSLTGSDSNTCGDAQSPSTPLRTIRAPFTKGCVSSGDIVWILAGTYTNEPGINEPAGVTVPNGTSGAHTVIRGDGKGVTILRPPNTGSANQWRLDNVVFIDFKALTIDSVNVAGGPFDALYLGDTGGVGADVLLEDVELMNADANGLFYKVNRMTMRRVHFHHNGTVATGFGVHGFYSSTGSNNTLIEYSEFDHNGNTGAGGSSGGQWNVGGASGLATGVVYRYNYNHDNSNAGHAFRTTGAEIYHNVFANNTSGNITFWGNNATGNKVYNNTSSGGVNAVQICLGYTGCTGNLLTNNHLISTSTAINGDASFYTSTTNRTTGAITDCTVSTSNFTQKGSANSCQSAGTPLVGFTYNGSNPEIGGHELWGSVSCVVENATPTKLSIIFENNVHPPILPATGITGITARKAGVNDVVTAAVRTGSNQVDLTLTDAIAGGDAVDISISGTNLTDSAANGGTVNQPYAFTLSQSACTNNVGGGGTHVFTQTAGAIYEALGPQTSTKAIFQVSPGGMFAVRTKWKGTVADPPATTTKLQCAVDGENGTYGDVPDTHGAGDCPNLRYVGNGAIEHMDLAGTATTERLTSEFTGMIAGGISRCGPLCSAPTLDLTQDSETEQVDMVEFDTDAAVDTVYWFRRVLNDNTVMVYAANSKPSIKVSTPSASGFASLPDQPWGLTASPNPTWGPRPSRGVLVSAGRSLW